MNNYLVIHADGSLPLFIPQYGSINETWHILMNDLDHNLCFECVKMDTPFDDLFMLVDDAAKLRPHSVNLIASEFYPGMKYGDYIAGTVMVCRMGLVPYTCDDGVVLMEHDLLPLLPDHVAYFKRIIDQERVRIDSLFEEISYD